MVSIENRIEHLEDRNRKLERIEQLLEDGEEDGVDIVNLDRLVRALVQQNNGKIVHENLHHESTTHEQSDSTSKVWPNTSAIITAIEMPSPKIQKCKLSFACRFLNCVVMFSLRKFN
ncbi:hypothetical protein DPMN_085146 [Dreissena polymorpha]|uniref:Uncharacterized protein n=1 Tax=Dreissena polymorpha TaxID=45954 RepID=A0A9D4BCL8_DREPO|nr:hypothetical protein DPMN_085146 [Dreissena polymorpha]